MCGVDAKVEFVVAHGGSSARTQNWSIARDRETHRSGTFTEGVLDEPAIP
jgi:hypothetical protein